MLQRSFHLTLLTFVLLTTTPIFAADPAPANPPSSGDPAPASPPVSTVIGGDPAPASPPQKFSSDPASASPPTSLPQDPAPASPPAVSEPIRLMEIPAAVADDPAQVGALGATKTTPLPALMEPARLSGKPFLGVGFRNPRNTVVTTLWSDSTATKLGIQLGDKIMAINDSTVGSLAQIRDVLRAMNVGDEVTVAVIRDDGSTVSVGPLPLGASYD